MSNYEDLLDELADRDATIADLEAQLADARDLVEHLYIRAEDVADLIAEAQDRLRVAERELLNL